jgi:hypothetical protein
MTATRASRRVEVIAFVLFGAAWLVSAGLTMVVTRLQLPTPEELLEDVHDRPVSWLAANVVLIVAPLTFAAIQPVLAGSVPAGTAARLVTLLLVVAGGSLLASGVFHGVLGAHLAPRVDDVPQPAGLVEASELLHALGDTWLFVGVGALTVLTAVVSALDAQLSRAMRWIGLLSVVCNVAQFGWFVDEAFGVMAAPAIVLQAAWFFAIAYQLATGRMITDSPRGFV